MNTDPTTCSHCSKFSTAIPYSLHVPSDGVASSGAVGSTGNLKLEVLSTEHLCGRREVHPSQLGNIVVDFKYVCVDGIEIPMTLAALGFLLNGKLEDWRRQARVIASLISDSTSRPWLESKLEPAVNRFGQEVLDGCIPIKGMDDLVIKFILDEFSPHDPASLQLEKQLLTEGAQRQRQEVRSLMQILKGDGIVEKATFVDESGMRLPRR